MSADLTDIHEEGEPDRLFLGIDGTMGDAQDVAHPYIESVIGAWCRVCGLNRIYRRHTDGSKRPPELSPEERKKRADQRDRGVLNERSDAGDACGCPCHQVVQPGLVPCPRCEQEGARP